MKVKYITSLALVFGITSCVVKDDTTSETSTQTDEITIKAEKTAEVNASQLEKKSDDLTSTVDYSEGKAIYGRTCVACHQATGEGIPGAFPPLKNSDYLMEDKMRAIKQVIVGSTGEIIVNGETYNSTMTPQNLSDQEIVDVLNYVYHAWGNDGETVTLADVDKVRASL
jgi:nitrite reductase (NO-forming)